MEEREMSLYEWCNRLPKSHRVNKELRAICGSFRRTLDALQFYADEKNWKSPSTGFALQYDPEPSPIEWDRDGDRARAALEGILPLEPFLCDNKDIA